MHITANDLYDFCQNEYTSIPNPNDKNIKKKKKK